MTQRLLAFIVLCLPAMAFATPNFPTALQNYLALSQEPDCQVCHSASDATGNNADTPFALSLRSYGLLPFSTASLETAIEGMLRDRVDSVGDGTPDIDDLRAGANPNLPQATVQAPPPERDLPSYGCTVTREGYPVRFANILAFYVLCALFMARKQTYKCGAQGPMV